MALIDFSLNDIGSLFTSAREAITGNKIIDPIEAAKIDLALQSLQNKLTSGQIDINKEEAKHPSIFVSGWRPFVGWVAGISLLLAFIPKALVLTAMWTYQVYLVLNGSSIESIEHTKIIMANLPLFPDLGTMDIIALLGSLLGIGTLRTYEKLKSIDTKQVGNKK